MSYYLAPALRALVNEVSERWSTSWPTVSIGDGWVGDTSHAARKSDHNPDWTAGGVVRAVDIGIAGRNAAEILDAVIGDRRVWYVIHKGVIYSRTNSWRAARYTGSNPHNHHIHVSLRGADGIGSTAAKQIEADTSRWLTPAQPKTPGVTRFLNAPNLGRRLELADALAKNGRTKAIRTNAKRWANRHRKAVRWANLRAASYRSMRKQEVK